MQNTTSRCSEGPRAAWLYELEQLIQRWSHHNVAHDAASMSVPDLWGLYLQARGLHADLAATSDQVPTDKGTFSKKVRSHKEGQ